MMVVASQQNDKENEYLSSRANYHKLKNKLYLSLMLSDYDDNDDDDDDDKTRGNDLKNEKKKKRRTCFNVFSLFVSNKKTTTSTTTKKTKKKIKIKDKFCYVSSMTMSREIVRI